MKTVELLTSDSLLALLPEDACYVAYSPQGVAIKLQRKSGGNINASAIVMNGDSSSTRVRILQADEETQFQRNLDNQVLSQHESKSRDPTFWWVYIIIPIVLLIAVALVFIKKRAV